MNIFLCKTVLFPCAWRDLLAWVLNDDAGYYEPPRKWGLAFGLSVDGLSAWTCLRAVCGALRPECWPIWPKLYVLQHACRIHVIIYWHSSSVWVVARFAIHSHFCFLALKHVSLYIAQMPSLYCNMERIPHTSTETCYIARSVDNILVLDIVRILADDWQWETGKTVVKFWGQSSRHWKRACVISILY